MRDIPAQLRRGRASIEMRESFAGIGRWLSAHNLEEFIRYLPPARRGEYRMYHSSIAAIGEDIHRRAGTLSPQISKNLLSIGEGVNCVRMAHQPNFAAYLKQFSMFVSLNELASLTNTHPIYIVNDCDVVRNERFWHSMWPDVTLPRGYRYIGLPAKRLSSSAISYVVERPEYEWLSTIRSQVAELLERENDLIGHYWESPEALSLNEIMQDLEFAWEQANSVGDLTSLFLSRMVNLRAGLNVIFLPGHLLWRIIGPRPTVDLLASWREVLAAQRSVANRLNTLGITGFRWKWLTDESFSPVWWLCSCNSRVALKFTNDLQAFKGQCNYCGANAEFHLSDVAHNIESGLILPRIGLFDLIEGMASDLLCGVTYMSSSVHSLIYGLVGAELGLGVLPQAFVDITGSFQTPIELMYESNRKPRSMPGLAEAWKVVVDGRASSLYYLTRIDARRLIDGLRFSVQNHEFDSPVDLGRAL